MTTKEYLEHRFDENYEIQCREFNKDLIEKYPWLSYEREWFWSEDNEYSGYYKNLEDDYKFTWLDAMDKGWRLAFGDKIVEELDNELRKHNYIDQFCISDIKEKWGQLRISTSALPKEIYGIINKYENLSYYTCNHCGSTARYLSLGYELPLCEECKNKLLEDNPNWRFEELCS